LASEGFEGFDRAAERGGTSAAADEGLRSMEAGELSRARVAGGWGVQPRTADDFGLEKTTAGCRLRNDSCDNLGRLTVDTAYLNDDDENRLAQWFHFARGAGSPAGGDLRTDFVYDGLSRLRKRQEYVWVSGGAGPLGPTGWTLNRETHYIYDGKRVIQDRDSNNTPTVSYTRGSDLSGSMEGAGGIGGLLARSSGYSGGNWAAHNTYFADGNGNVTYVLNSSQAMAASYRYDPFGNTVSSSGTLASASLYRFSSKEIHANSGMYYYLYRFYDPNLQRWINRDPIGERGGANLYEFVRNSPLGWIDPAGLVLKIDPSADPTFIEHIRQCLCKLVNGSQTGLDLVNRAIDNDHTITITPDPAGAGTIGAINSTRPGWPSDPTIGIYPRTPNGVAPDDQKEAKRYHEDLPNNLAGCAVVIAHELGHALTDWNELKVVPRFENPVRKDLGIRPRKTYHGKELPLDVGP
jgi:RHS repeat-associated protein